MDWTPFCSDHEPPVERGARVEVENREATEVRVPSA